MTTPQVAKTRAAINEVVAKLTAAGHHDAAARLELAREYTLNPEFRAALQQHVWEITTKGAAKS